MYPKNKLQRYRHTAQMRQFVCERTISVKDFIMPIFINEAIEGVKAVPSLPGINQYSLPSLFDEVAEIVSLGIPAVILFGIPKQKDQLASEAFNDSGVIQRGIRLIKEHFPELVVIADCCLCEYTDHGQCGVLKQGKISGAETLETLGKIAVSYAEAGVDIVAPSGMIDGMVSEIRAALDQASYDMVSILSYSTKFASCFYGPFREAAGSNQFAGDRKHHQLSPTQGREALLEAECDIQEGADMMMVKPALAYLDIIRQLRDRYSHPLVAYHVSGEYAMVKHAARAAMVDESAAFEEIFVAMKRAGADRIISYFAKQYARNLKNELESN